MSFLEDIVAKAKQESKTIVLPEGFDSRIPEAAALVSKSCCAKIVILGKKIDIEKVAPQIDVASLENVICLDYLNSPNFSKYVQKFYEMRKAKGMTIEKAEDILKNPLYYGAMMVKEGEVDGMVAGAANSSGDTIKCSLLTVKMAPDVERMSTCTILVLPNQKFGENGLLIFSDTAMYEIPNREEMCQIALSSANFFEMLTGSKAKVGMLSYSTKGSAKSDSVTKVIEATELAQQKNPELLIDGELQFDSAISPAVANLKAKSSDLHGEANVLIFPDLNSANIACKVAENLVPAELYGPVSQGLAKPINDVSRAASASDIMGIIAITVIQAQNLKS
ncbi:MAG: phosphotransacetylase [bacterium]|nr:phosphotransacetylase [bacterium]